jgi:tRNA pseudouridine55 synthase
VQQEAGKVLLVNKPYGWTSFDVVKKVRNMLHEKKIGHAGTLDPLATGLLILCTGKATKQISSIQGSEKEYTGTFCTGSITPSFDRETEVSMSCIGEPLLESDIYKVAESFTGKLMQVPPKHSAVKVSGKRAYKMARAGQDFHLEAKPVDISTFEITAIDLPFIHFRIVCSKGTYIRSVARDFGSALGTGAYLYELCRVRIGAYRLKDALTIEALQTEQAALNRQNKTFNP